MAEKQAQSGKEVSTAGMKPLSVKESERLEKLEKVIKDNFMAFYAVGCALREIRDSKLYRETHERFEDYCKEVWETGRRRAYQFIDATAVFENVNNCAQNNNLPLPLNEAQVRPLTRDELSPDDQIQCWKAACQKAQLADRKVTAHYVEEAVVEFLGGRVKRQLREIRKNLNDAEFLIEFKRAMTPVVQMLADAQENNWKDTNRQKVKELLDIEL